MQQNTTSWSWLLGLVLRFSNTDAFLGGGLQPEASVFDNRERLYNFRKLHFVALSYTTKIQYPVLIMLWCVCFSNFLYCWVLQNFVSLHKHAISYTHTSNWKVIKYCILFCLGVWQVSFSFWPQTLKQSVRVTAFGRGLLFRFVCAPTPVLHDSVFIVGSQLSE